MVPIDVKPFVTLAALSVFVLSTFSWGAPMPDITRQIVSPATVLAVHDGDSLLLAVSAHRSFVGPIRLQAVFALELAIDGGKKAQAHLLRLLPIGSKVRVLLSYTKEGHPIESLCRPLATVWVEETGVNVNETHTKWLKANGCWGGNQ